MPQVNVPNGLFVSRSALHQELVVAGKLPETLSTTNFCKLLARLFPNVCFQKWTPFSKCDICIRIKQTLFGSLGDAADLQQALLQAHRDDVSLSRQLLAARTALALAFPDIFGCGVVDAMDSAKTYSPHVSTSFVAGKGLSNAGAFLKNKLVGMLQQGVYFTGFVTYPHYAGGPNILCSVLHLTFTRHVQQFGKLPQVFFVQLDNCGGDNKNHTVFAYLAYLVQQRVFHVVYVYFLIVGKVFQSSI